MNKRFIAGALGAAVLAIGALALKAKEPTVMTINGIEVPLSEFEYLYSKNQAQTQMQQLDEYVDIFKLYKLKVADGLAMGLDTMKAFKDEYVQYREELAQPYLTDSAYIADLVDEAYNYYQTQVHPYHIMIAKTPDALQNRASVNSLDSLRRILVEGKADFTTIASQYSQDRGSKSKGGDLGWSANPYYPYAFLKAAYSLQPGQISEVVETPTAYHLVMVEGRRPNDGYLSASHIFKRIAPKSTDADIALLKNQIDSIYAVILASPEKFEEMAVRFSDDGGSKQRGGKLEPFSRGHYPQPFDSIAFAMADGQISAPFMTPFGWHIVKRFGTRPLESQAAMQKQLTAVVTNPRDIRARMIDDRQLNSLGREFKLKPVRKNLTVIEKYIAANGIDSLFMVNLATRLGNAPLYTFKGGQLTFADLTPQLQNLVNLDPEFASAEFNERINAALRHKLLPLKEASLEVDHPEYRNLLHEFHDGSLVYEAGRIRVWDRASTDTVGLMQFFADHRGDYKWQQPRAKGFLVQVTNDSIENLVKQRIAALTPEEYIPVLRKEFADQVQIDRVLAQKGVNAMVDHLAFGEAETKPANSRYNCYFMVDLRLLNAPEEMTDVRGLVITDYQNYLMQQWEDDLKNKYPVVVNEKVLKKLRTN